MAVNTQKLLPVSKSSALAVRTSKISVGKEKGGTLVKSEGGVLAKEIVKMKVKIIKLQGEVDKNRKLGKKEQEDKRKSGEKEKKEKREKQLEKKGPELNLPNVISRLPGGSIIDTIKRFLGFTFLGWLVGKYEQLMPQLEKFMSLTKPVFEGLVFATESVIKGVYGFVETGYKAYDKVSATIKQIGGENAEKTFNEFSGHLNKLLNGTLIAAMVIASTSPGRGSKGLGRTPGGKPSVGGSGKPNQRLQGYLNRNPQAKLIERRYGNEAARMYEARRSQGLSNQRALADVRSRFQPVGTQGSLGGTNRGSRIFGRGLTKAPQRAATKVFGKAAGKTVSKLGGRVPIVGPLIDFGIRTLIYKEPLGKAAAGAVGMGVGQAIGGWLGGAIGGIVGSVVPFIGTLLVGAAGATVGSLIGGVVGDMIGVALYDFVAGSNKKKPTKRATGGPVSSRQPARRRVSTAPTRQKIRPQETKPGKDVGGRYKIEEFYGKEKINRGSSEDTRTRGQEIVKALEKTSKDVKKLPLDWVASIGGAYVDLTMGQKPDKKLATDVGKSFGVFVETVVNNEISATTGQITKALVGMANGGSVPGNNMERGQISKKVGKNIEERLQSIFDQSYSIVMKNIKNQFVLDERESYRGPTPGAPRGPGGGGGPGGDYTDIQKIELGAFSQDDIDTLGRMIQAESGNQSAIGKAAVMSVILNRYRLAKAGDRGYMPPGKNKDNVTLKDIIYDPGQFSPITDGRFDKTTSEAGKNALEAAINSGGNDPQKMKKKLIDAGFSKSDADYIIVSTAFSNPETRSRKPFDTKEVIIGNHSFQESPYSRLKTPGTKVSATIRKFQITGTSADKARHLIVMAGRAGYRQVKPGEAAPEDYLHHGSEATRRGLIVRDYGITPQVHGGSQMLEGEGAPVVVPFGARAKAVIQGPHSVRFEDPTTGKVVAVYHHLENVPRNINGKILTGGTFIGTQGGRPGAASAYGSSSAVHVHLEGTADWHKKFISTYAGGLDVTRTNIPRSQAVKPMSILEMQALLNMTSPPTGVSREQTTLLKEFVDNRRVLGINLGAGHQGPGGQGTADPITGVAEHQATLHMLNAIKQIIIQHDPDLAKVTTFHSFRDANFAKDNAKMFSKMRKQMIELHFDQFGGGGRSGVIHARGNRYGVSASEGGTSALDIALMKRFGNYGKNFKLGDLGIADTGGTILEFGAIDSMPELMREIKSGKIGPETLKLARYTYLGIREGAETEGLVKKMEQDKLAKALGVEKQRVGTADVGPSVEQQRKSGVPLMMQGTPYARALVESRKKAEKDRKIWNARPWWDKFGWFGGAAAEAQRNKPKRKQLGGPVLSSGQSSYSSLNRSGLLKEDTSLNKEMVVMYQKEIVMVPQTA